jgi:hypothetical protein
MKESDAHSEHARQTRSLEELGAVIWYCDGLQTVHAEHCVLMTPLQPPVAYSPALHDVHGKHARSDDEVSRMEMY